MEFYKNEAIKAKENAEKFGRDIISHHNWPPGTSSSHVPNYPKIPSIPACNPFPFPSYQQTPIVRPPFQQHQYSPFRYHPMTFVPRLLRPDTFWASCSRCLTLYEYHRMFLNQNLQCHFCQQYFSAMEIPAPEETKAASSSNAVTKRKTNLKKNDRAGDETGRRSSSEIKRASNVIAEAESRNLKESSRIRLMLIEKAKMGILDMLKEWEEPAEPKCDVILRVKTEQTRATFLSRDTPKDKVQPRKSSASEAADDGSVSMAVPDANFCNFDDERVEASFSANQVWAAYDDDDGMPRFYAMVHRVISRKPFEIEISWLNSRSTSEFGSLDWIGSRFTKTCGGFRVGKYVVIKRLTYFSHPVKYKKGPRGAIQIFPTKGDVWAMYRNWSPDWVKGTTDAVTIHKYGLVVVTENYGEDVGVVVAPLVKMAGFTSVFYLNESGTHTITREEMFRFSHQVPFRILHELEGENAPMGCYELDPAALPLELLEVMEEAEE